MSAFEFKAITINQLIAHTVFAKNNALPVMEPKLSGSLLELNDDEGDAKALVQQRLTEALGSRSHGVETAIARNTSDDFAQIAAKMLNADDADFVLGSQQLAIKLQAAHTSTRWPGGILILISGTVGHPANRFIAAIKAETDKGFNAVEKDGKLMLQVVKRMLLSATQRLYKVGLLVQIGPMKPGPDGIVDAAHFRCFLFDHLFNNKETARPASYFYDAFLGMAVLESNREKTRIFYEQSKSFISNCAELSNDEKISLREALRTTLRSNAATINADEFAKEHLAEKLQGEYLQALRTHGFPDNAVAKDLEYIKYVLRKPPSTKFSTGVEVKAPPDGKFEDLVRIGEVVDGYTKIEIKGVVTSYT
ncbi:nucleoid-associated protein [Schauerella aestuarii]|uniref:nucleoid-associated protein n=1 Tax=Schauerella aestuarii TaxID=2511204 RepID=UPI00136B39A0|nr:nucleoid-associated protein [Achromobacter aestuarii]MYZ44235.1 hypothetical protein [Achromobacter aestuarii]